MKLYVRASRQITNDYLSELFNQLDYDDADYADRLVDRTIKKYLSVGSIFDQAKYINMLDEDVKSELMSLLESPEAIHEKRMRNKEKSRSRRSKSRGCELYVKFEDYPDGNIKQSTFFGNNRLEALKSMITSLLLCLDVDTIEEDDLSEDAVIEELESRNGDGCDYIIRLEDRSTGEIIMDCPFEEECW
jgi:hypothetical protein